MSLAERAATDVVVLHDLFVAMFAGRAGAGALTDAMGRMAPDFIRIGPEGEVQDRAAVEAMLAAAVGNVSAEFAIRITIEEARELTPGAAMVRYREDQTGRGGASTSRRSTAVFVDTEEGLRWSALHETWIGAADRGATTRGEADT